MVTAVHMLMTTTCPDCSEPRGGRYRQGGIWVCWPCWMRRTGLGPLPAHTPTGDPEWKIFRKRIVDALWALNKQRFCHINTNRVVGACPVCLDGTVRVDFHGSTARADISCSFGCDELDIAHGLGRLTRGTPR